MISWYVRGTGLLRQFISARPLVELSSIGESGGLGKEGLELLFEIGRDNHGLVVG